MQGDGSKLVEPDQTSFKARMPVLGIPTNFYVPLTLSGNQRTLEALQGSRQNTESGGVFPINSFNKYFRGGRLPIEVFSFLWAGWTDGVYWYLPARNIILQINNSHNLHHFHALIKFICSALSSFSSSATAPWQASCRCCSREVPGKPCGCSSQVRGQGS